MTPSSQDLAALLADIEQAPHGDSGLDLDVMEAVWPTWQKDTITDDAKRYVTSSLDAALALCERVLPGWRRQLSEDGPSAWWASVLMPDPKKPGLAGYCCDTRPSPALALLAAMLKALIAKDAP